MEKEKKTQTLAMKVQSSVLSRLTDIADHEDRPIGYIARELMMRGLALYEADGRLRDQAGKSEASQEKAPIVAQITPASKPSPTEDERDAIRRQLEADIPTADRHRKAG